MAPTLPAVQQSPLATRGQEPRRVLLQSQPISVAPAKGTAGFNPFEPPAPAPPLANFEAQHGRVGCSSVAGVKAFCDRQLFGEDVLPAHLPPMAKAGTRLQRLRGTKAVDERRPMGVPTDDPMTQLQKNARTRLQADLIGVAIERDALRRTPLERQGYVVRPGFSERGRKQEERLRQLREEDERRYLAYRHEVSEATRRRMRQTRERNVQSTLRQPVLALPSSSSYYAHEPGGSSSSSIVDGPIVFSSSSLMQPPSMQRGGARAMASASRRDAAEQEEALRALGAFERVHRVRVIEEADEEDDE